MPVKTGIFNITTVSVYYNNKIEKNFYLLIESFKTLPHPDSPSVTFR